MKQPNILKLEGLSVIKDLTLAISCFIADIVLRSR